MGRLLGLVEATLSIDRLGQHPDGRGQESPLLQSFEVLDSVARCRLGVDEASGTDGLVRLAHTAPCSKQFASELTVELDATLVLLASGVIVAQEGEMQGPCHPQRRLDRGPRVLGEQLVTRTYAVRSIDPTPRLEDRSIAYRDRGEPRVTSTPCIVGCSAVGSASELRASQPAFECCRDVPSLSQRRLIVKLFQLGDQPLNFLQRR